MARWRKKLMPLAEWAQLQERFGDLQMVLRGHPDLAMFCKSQPGDELSAIYITGPHLDAIEGFSPGGWEDSEKPSGEGVALLVGTAESWERLRVSREREE